MLTFEEKLAIFESFPELQRRDVSLGRVNFHYENSTYDKKTVAYHLHPNGNGFVYADLLQGYATDDKGFVNIRDFSAEELRTVTAESIRSLSTAHTSAVYEEQWIDSNRQTLTVKYEDELWYVYAGLSLESVFETYDEVEEYMEEEEFSRK